MRCEKVQERFELSLVILHYTLRSGGNYVFGLGNSPLLVLCSFYRYEGLISAWAVIMPTRISFHAGLE
jgi:hypothetical protein